MVTFGIPQKNVKPTLNTSYQTANSTAQSNVKQSPLLVKPFQSGAASPLPSGVQTVGGTPVGLISTLKIDPTGAMGVTSKAPTVAKSTSEALSGLYSKLSALRGMLGKGTQTSARTGFPSAADNFAEKSFSLTRNAKPGGASSAFDEAIPFRNNTPIKSGQNLPGDVVRSGASDIKPITPPKSNITTKTTASRTGQIDTRLRPTTTGTKQTPVPKGKLPIGTGAVGLGALGLGASLYSQMGADQAPDGYAPLTPSVPSSEGAAPSNDPLSPSNVFNTPTQNQEGGVFESSVPAPQVAGFGTGGSPAFGTPAGGIAGTSYGGAAVSPFTSVAGDAIQTSQKSPRELALEELLRSRDLTDEEKAARAKENDLAKKIAELTGYRELENLEIEGEPISADARQGRRNLIDRETRRSLVPLQTSLALVQALRERSDQDRENRFADEKYRFENLYPSEESSGFTLGAGQQRYQYNPETGQYEMVGNAPAASAEDKVLSPTEAMALGVPYGTTQSQAYGQIPQKQPTQGQFVANLYATRMGEANQILQGLQNAAVGMNPALFAAYGAIEPNQLGNAFVPDEFRQIRQAERNFLNAVLRRESGAVISPSEFAEGARQYFPRPGDDQQTLLQKAQARQTAVNALVQEAQGTFQGFGSTPSAYGDPQFSW